MSTISELISRSYLTRRGFVTDDLVKAINILTEYSTVPYIDHKFKSGTEFNGWVVPQKWEVSKAKIFFKGKEVYDGLCHPLGVMTHCGPFKGSVSLDELKKHLYFTEKRPNAIPFHFRFMYRPWESDWGFCMPKTIVDKLKNGSYQIDIESKLEKGTMIVREFTLKGKTDEAIIFAAHIDHAGQANDDVAGCAVGITLLEAIKKKYKSRRFTYKLVLTQEIVGSVFYLNKLKKKQLGNLKYGIFLEMLGNENTLNLQKSLNGNTYIDKVCELALVGEYRVCGFRESAGNDEIVFEAPGYEIPMPSISRWPYDEYHTSDDNMQIIKEEKLQESLEYLLKVVSILENDVYVKRNFSGLVSLANPKYDLYIDPGQIIGGTLGQNSNQAAFQYKMPNQLDGTQKISDLARLFNLDFWWLLGYFNKMKEKKLVKLSVKKHIK
jgi:aminopeptidase-like protein